VKLISDDPAFRKPDRPDSQNNLEILEHHGGEAYLIGAGGGGYSASRRDGKGGTPTAPDRDGLSGNIQAEYDADPVPRELS